MKLTSPKTKIVCTIGPASETPDVMKQMIEAGMTPGSTSLMAIPRETPMPENWNTCIKRQVADLGREGKIAILSRGPSREHSGANHGVEILDLTL